MRVGLSYDLKEAVPVAVSVAEDALEEYDSKETVGLIASCIEAGGHETVMLGGGWGFLDNIRKEKVDLVFNISEGLGNYRSREAQIPSVLEMLGIPYSGSDPQCLAICLDKPLTKKLLVADGIPTPAWRVVNSLEDMNGTDWSGFSFPVIIKPVHEGSSKGIHGTSLAHSQEEMRAEISRLVTCYNQPVMVEEFISGDEVTVGVVGNGPDSVLGVMRILPKDEPEHFVYSLEVKRDYKNRVAYECPARLSPEYLSNIQTSSLRVFESLGCRDFSRIDYRIASDGTPYFIDINPLPGLGTHSDLVIMAIQLGYTHEALVNRILNTALVRCSQCVRV
jgi:D-alanine-D-alanine ligase